MLGQRLPELNV